MTFFTPDKNILKFLGKKDKKLGAFIAKRGSVTVELYNTPFSALVHSVIAQQVTKAAADSAKKRLLETFNEIVPQNFKNATTAQLTACGLSARKAEYIIGITSLANDRKLEYNDLDKLSDQEITDRLLQIRGVGSWTAQMLLIFCFCRPNVASYGDFGIRHGAMNLYCLNELSEEKFNRLSKRWEPYKTTASLYLWQAAVDKELEAIRKAKFAKQKE